MAVGNFQVRLAEIIECSLTIQVLWLRYIAIVRRGSAKIFLHKLPDKLTPSGQGGGGPLSLQELKEKERAALLLGVFVTRTALRPIRSWIQKRLYRHCTVELWEVLPLLT